MVFPMKITMETFRVVAVFHEWLWFEARYYCLANEVLCWKFEGQSSDNFEQKVSMEPFMFSWLITAAAISIPLFVYISSGYLFITPSFPPTLVIGASFPSRTRSLTHKPELLSTDTMLELIATGYTATQFRLWAANKFFSIFWARVRHVRGILAIETIKR